jgi:anti-sigma B factor antagonist
LFDVLDARGGPMLPDNSDAERRGGELPRFSCRSVTLPGCVHVVPQGELDIAAIPLLDHALRAAGETVDDVVLDLRELDFIDSSGAHLLIAADRRFRRSGGRLRVISGSGEVAWLLQLVGVDRELEVIEPPQPEGSIGATHRVSFV